MSVDKITGKKQRSGNPNPKPGPGRPKGSQNKVSGLAKDNIAKVFEELNGIDGMVSWALQNQTEFYKMYSKLLPIQVTGENGGDINITIKKVVHSARDNG